MQNMSFHYGVHDLEIVSKFVYLGAVFSAGGSFSEAQCTLARQSLKALFKINKYLHKITYIDIRHYELFDKLVLPILNYGCEVWGCHPGKAVERLHVQFCKQLLGVKKNPQNEFVYGELGRMPLRNTRYYALVNF